MWLNWCIIETIIITSGSCGLSKIHLWELKCSYGSILNRLYMVILITSVIWDKMILSGSQYFCHEAKGATATCWYHWFATFIHCWADLCFQMSCRFLPFVPVNSTCCAFLVTPPVQLFWFTTAPVWLYIQLVRFRFWLYWGKGPQSPSFSISMPLGPSQRERGER